MIEVSIELLIIVALVFLLIGLVSGVLLVARS